MTQGQRTVIVTRPERAAYRFAESLARKAGAAARILISPVLEIVPLPVDCNLSSYPTLIFTSENAVRAMQGQAGPAGRGAYCVGDRTAAAAEHAGWRARSAAGDAAALEALLLAERPPGPWLCVTGAHRRVDLATRLTAAGCPTDRVVAYEQAARPLTAEALAALRAGPALLPVFSPRSAALLSAAMPPDAMPPVVVAISPAAAAAWAGAARAVLTASAPDAATMAAAVLNVLKTDSHC